MNKRKLIAYRILFGFVPVQVMPGQVFVHGSDPKGKLAQPELLSQPVPFVPVYSSCNTLASAAVAGNHTHVAHPALLYCPGPHGCCVLLLEPAGQ